MRLVTFNMRQGGSRLHWQRAMATEPSLLFVQETRSPAPLLDDLFDPLVPVESCPGPPRAAMSWAGVGHGRWGSAVWIAAGELQSISVPGFEGWVSGGRVIGGRVRGIGDDLLAFSVHLPPRGSCLAAGHQLLDALEPLVDGTPLILAGDWNFTPCPRTKRDPLPQRAGELEFLRRLKGEFGLDPAWRAVNPEGALPQTLRWMREPTTPYHCDGVFLGPEHLPAVTGARVLASDDWTALSDHNPMVVEVGG